MVKKKSAKKRAVKAQKIHAEKRRRRATTQQMLIPDKDAPEEITDMELTEGKVKKITTKIIVGKKRDAVGETTLLYRVIGVATGVKAGESNYGPWKALRGEFEAKRASDGKIFKAPLMVLPEEVIDRIHARLVVGSPAVGFAVSVIAHLRAAAPGYGYSYEYDVEPHAHEPLAALRKYL